MMPTIVGPSGLVVDEPKSPLPNQNTNLHFGYNPPLVASCVRDTLRFLFETAAPDHLKYNSDPKKSKVAVDLSFDTNQDEAEMMRPKITVNRGPYRASPIGISDSMTESTSVEQDASGKSRMDEFMNMIDGTCTIRITAYNMGTCEELAYLVTTFLVWSRPMICNTLGFKNIAAPLSASPLNLDKDDKTKYVIEVNVPYSTEMRWINTELGVKLKGFLLQLT